MPGFVSVSGFTGIYTGLNGTLPLTARRRDVIRSLLTVGYRSRRAATKRVGKWRARLLVALAKGYLEHDLRTTRYFRALEQTEKVGVSFLLGEAFTHWFAQKHLSLYYVIHVCDLKSGGLASAGTLSLKSGGTPPGAKSRPDFIGFNSTERHIFESKGRQRRPSAGAWAKALGQVSAIASINGAVPTTRCATYLVLKASGAEGYVVDPERDEEIEGYSASFSEFEALEHAYAIFFDDEVGELVEVRPGLVGKQIDDDAYFAIDQDVYRLVADAKNSPTEDQAALVMKLLDSRQGIYKNWSDDTTSAGTDGTVLIMPNGIRRRRLG